MAFRINYTRLHRHSWGSDGDLCDRRRYMATTINITSRAARHAGGHLHGHRRVLNSQGGFSQAMQDWPPSPTLPPSTARCGVLPPLLRAGPGRPAGGGLLAAWGPGACLRWSRNSMPSGLGTPSTRGPSSPPSSRPWSPGAAISWAGSNICSRSEVGHRRRGYGCGHPAMLSDLAGHSHRHRGGAGALGLHVTLSSWSSLLPPR